MATHTWWYPVCRYRTGFCTRARSVAWRCGYCSKSSRSGYVIVREINFFFVLAYIPVRLTHLRFFLLTAGLRIAQPHRYCFYSVVQNGFFAPQGCRSDTLARNPCPLPVPNFTFFGAKIWEYSPETVKSSNFVHKLATSRVTRLHNFYEVLSFSTRLYR